jgi:hypothetical protein
MLDELTGGSADAIGTLPLRSLQAAAQGVAAVTLQRVPTPVRQKRFFVSRWYAEARRTSALASPMAPTRRREDLYGEIDARLRTQRKSITQPELPDAVCAHFAEEINKLEGRTSLHGRPVHEKRMLVHEWHEAQARASRVSSGAPHGQQAAGTNPPPHLHLRQAAPESAPPSEPPPAVRAPHDSLPPHAPPGSEGVDRYGAAAGGVAHLSASASVALRARGRPDLAGTVIIIE